VFSHISASLNGLSTIRAFEAQEMVRKEFDTHQVRQMKISHTVVGRNNFCDVK